MTTKPWISIVFILPVVALAFVLFQVHWIARVPTPWLHIDVVSIFVFWVAFNLRLGMAIFVTACACALIEVQSGIKPGFYLMYYSQLLLLPYVERKLWVDPPAWSRYLLFPAAFLAKQFWLFLLVLMQGDHPPFIDFMWWNGPSFMATCVAQIPVCTILTWLAARLDMPLGEPESTIREQTT